MVRSKEVIFNTDINYVKFITELKEKIRSVQVKAALTINSHLIDLYWELGHLITKQLFLNKWGAKIIEQLASDLSKEFKEMKGFSRSNMYFIYQWYNFYLDESQIVQQLVRQIPWGHNILLVNKTKDVAKAIWYTKQTIEHGWSRSVLLHQLELNLYERQGKKDKISNFVHTLPKPQSDLATQALKDPYVFDFLSIGKNAEEREIEKELTKHIQKFLLELGSGFAFVGNQYHLEIDGEDYYIDLLFYHLKLRCYVVIELKAKAFKPEHIGKLNFYLSAVDGMLRHKYDNPTIGMVLCKDKGGKVKGEYALKDINKPIGLAEYKIVESIPEELKTELPSIEELEKELSGK
jgi:predicted nuclease of restriction endonuclease-like (RecB) superfamily